jgi:hypothetical protein
MEPISVDIFLNAGLRGNAGNPKGRPAGRVGGAATCKIDKLSATGDPLMARRLGRPIVDQPPPSANTAIRADDLDIAAADQA